MQYVRGDADALFRIAGPLCGGCPLRNHCGASLLASACRPRWGDEESGGPNAHHPLNPETRQHFDDVGGADLEQLEFGPVAAPPLPALMHVIRPGRRTTTYRESAYVVGLDAVVRQRPVPTAAEIRAQCGLWSDQAIVLALFGEDDDLEHLWARREEMIPELGVGGYAAILSASYSIYGQHPPSEWLLHTKRSYWMAAELQRAGATVIPRGGWIERWQMLREAAFYRDHQQLRAIALDIGTLKPQAEWDNHMRLLREFDRLTGRRLVYVIRGPSTLDRVLELYRLLTPHRVRLVSARSAAYPARGQDVNRDVARARRVWSLEEGDGEPVLSRSRELDWGPSRIRSRTRSRANRPREIVTGSG